MNSQHDPVFQDRAVTQQFPSAALFCVYTLDYGLRQNSRIALTSIHMDRILWLKAWTAESACKKHLTCMPYREGRLFGETLV